MLLNLTIKLERACRMVHGRGHYHERIHHVMYWNLAASYHSKHRTRQYSTCVHACSGSHNPSHQYMAEVRGSQITASHRLADRKNAYDSQWAGAALFLESQGASEYWCHCESVAVTLSQRCVGQVIRRDDVCHQNRTVNEWSNTLEVM